MASPHPTPSAHRHPFVQNVAAGLKQHCRVQPGDALLVAVSGGADSVALLRALAVLAPRKEWKLKLSVGHVQHHLRDEAEEDARFVEAMAKELGLPFLRADLELKGKAKGNLEGNARRQRYDALVTMARAAGANAIVTAHHGDDQLETLLMRLLRGTGVRGLRGMAWRRRVQSSEFKVQSSDSGHSALRAPHSALVLLRPMLGVSRADVLAYLADLKQSWREDHTNADATRWRAKLRRDVLPHLHDLRMDAPQRATSLADHVRQVSRVLDDAVRAMLDRVVVEGNERIIDRTDARSQRVVVLGGLLRKLLIEMGVGADRLTWRALKPMVRAIRDTTGGTRTFDLTGGVKVKVTRATVTIQGI